MCQTFCNTKCQKKVDIWLSDFVVIKLRPRILDSVICEEKEKIISDKKKYPDSRPLKSLTEKKYLLQIL